MFLGGDYTVEPGVTMSLLCTVQLQRSLLPLPGLLPCLPADEPARGTEQTRPGAGPVPQGRAWGIFHQATCLVRTKFP